MLNKMTEEISGYTLPGLKHREIFVKLHPENNIQKKESSGSVSSILGMLLNLSVLRARGLNFCRRRSENG